MGTLVSNISRENVTTWFSGIGMPHQGYLDGHYERFEATHTFVSESLPPKSTILDIGAHWLHQAMFFANDGHKLICADVPFTLNEPVVQKAAKAMGADILPYENLGRADGIISLPNDSVDAVLFFEIIEHITFNPIPMWAEIYRVLKPGGRIFVSTPNAAYFLRMIEKLEEIFTRDAYGITVSSIFENGTYGHHWKEYTPPEIAFYFRMLSPDFRIARNNAITIRYPEAEVQGWYRATLDAKPLVGGVINVRGLVESLMRQGCQPFGHQIFSEIHLPVKERGIVIAPPWIA